MEPLTYAGYNGINLRPVDGQSRASRRSAARKMKSNQWLLVVISANCVGTILETAIAIKMDGGTNHMIVGCV